MTQQSSAAESERQRPEPTHRLTYTGRAATTVTAIAAAAVITAATPPASAASTGAVASPTGSTSSAAVPPWQHPSSDPTDNCVLLPDPGSSGDMLYPAGDDSATGVQDSIVAVDTLANDCANNTPGTTRVWAASGAVPPDQYAAGDFDNPIGQVTSGPMGVSFVPPAGFVGTVQFSYQTIEAGTETNQRWSGPYADRHSSLATVTVTITAPTPPTPTATPSGVRTSRPPAPRPDRTPAPALAPKADPPRLAATGATPKAALGLGLGLLGVGGAAAIAGRRRRRSGTHRSAS